MQDTKHVLSDIKVNSKDYDSTLYVCATINNADPRSFLISRKELSILFKNTTYKTKYYDVSCIHSTLIHANLSLVDHKYKDELLTIIRVDRHPVSEVVIHVVFAMVINNICTAYIPIICCNKDKNLLIKKHKFSQILYSLLVKTNYQSLVPYINYDISDLPFGNFKVSNLITNIITLSSEASSWKIKPSTLQSICFRIY